VLILDSDVLLIDCRYPRDARYGVNQRFLQELATLNLPRATTLFNVLEICGVLTFNLSPPQLRQFYAGIAHRYGLQILDPHLPPRPGQRMIDLLAGRTLGVILRRVSFSDALVILTAETSPDATAFVTWNATHFVGRTRLEVLNPQQWLAREGIVV
jgi:hypothetical protein